MFRNTPYAYKLIKIDKVPQMNIDNYKRDLGTCMHKVIKEYYRRVDKVPTPDFIEKTTKAMFTNNFDQSLSEHKIEAEGMLRNFITFEKGRLKDYRLPVLIEQYLEDDLYKGIPDMFDGLHIYDWKFGGMTRLYDDQRIQGKVYDRLITNAGYKPPENYSSFKPIFVTLANTCQLEMPLTTNIWLETQRQNMLDMIAAGNFPLCRGPLCPWCSVPLSCAFRDTKLWDCVDNIWNLTI